VGKPVKCQRCGAVRPAVEMASQLRQDAPPRYWCHGFLDPSPTCYMRASWAGEVYLDF
jgi:hypothetical protein